MTPGPDTHRPAQTARLMHASLLIGQLLLLGVTYLTVRPDRAEVAPLSDGALGGLVGVSFGACLLALVLRRRIPARPHDASTDLYWSTALAPALIAWMPLEAAGLLALSTYFRTLDPWTLGAAALPMALLLLLNPWVLERR